MAHFVPIQLLFCHGACVCGFIYTYTHKGVCEHCEADGTADGFVLCCCVFVTSPNSGPYIMALSARRGHDEEKGERNDGETMVRWKEGLEILKSAIFEI